MTNNTPLLPASSCSILECEVQVPHLHAEDPRFVWVESVIDDWEE